MGTYTIADDAALKGFLKNLLEKGIVDGIMVPSKGEHGIFNSMITDPEHVKDSVPLAPLFSTNTASYLQHNGAKKVAAVLKPCEARAVNELAKLHQVDLEKLVVICSDCQGTIDPKDGVAEAPLSEAAIKELEGQGVPLRKACTVCEHFTPPDADVSIYTIGSEGGYVLDTDRAELVDGLDLPEGQAPAGRDAEVERLLKEHTEAKGAMVEDITAKLSSHDSLVEVFKHCIRCDNCREVCPVCYCKECYFQTPIGDLCTDDMVNQARVRGRMRVPPDIFFYHLTRNIHIAPGCVECGACGEACPRDIPLLSMWKAMTGDVQAQFQYVSGAKKDEPMPLVTFKEAEFEELGSE